MKMYNDMMNTDLYELAKELDRFTASCRRYSRCLWVFSVILIMMPVAFVSISFICDFAQTKTIIIYATSFCIFYVFYRRYQSKEIHIYKRINKLYNTLADRVDWTDLRNKALYGSVDRKIVIAMNNFVEYSLSMLCIHEKGKKLFLIFDMLSMLMFIITVVVSTFIDIF